MSNQTNKDEQEQKSLIRQQSMQNFLANSVTKKKGIGGHVRDTGLSLLSGAVSVPETAVGLADIVSGGNVGKFLENENGAVGFRPKEAKEAIAGWKTERAQRQLQDFQNAEGLGAKFGQAWENKSLIANTVLESLPAMGAGGVIGRGLGVAAKGISPLVGGALGEGAVGAGLAAEQIRQQTDDGLLTGKQAGLAAATGVTTAAFGFGGGRLAKKLGISDFDTVAAGGRLAEGGGKGIAKRVAGGALSEGFLEELPQSVSETILQNEALGRPLGEGVEDAAVLGLLSGATMGGVVGGITRNRTPTTDDITSAAGGMPQFRGPLSREDLQARIQGPAPQMVGPNQQPPLVGPVAQGAPYLQSAIQGPALGLVGPNQQPSLIGPTQQPPLVGPITPPPLIGPIQQLGAAIPQEPKPSVLMGLDANNGSLSSAAVIAVDSGASQQIASQQAQDAAEQGVMAQASEQGRSAADQRAGELRANAPYKMNVSDAQANNKAYLADYAKRNNMNARSADPATRMAGLVEVENLEQPTGSKWLQGMRNSLANADPNDANYQTVAAAIEADPKSVPERARLKKQVESLAKKPEPTVKTVNPKARVLDEAKAKSVAYNPRGDEIPTQFDVVDASDLVSSHSNNFVENPNYPQQYQPRDRAKAGYQAQVLEIFNRFKPHLLGDDNSVNAGSPIVGPNDNLVESGNGRTIAIRKIYEAGKGDAYRQFVNEQAEKFGLDTNAINYMQQPVLVRRNMSGMDRETFARRANDPASAEMSATERAQSDARILPSTDLLEFTKDGELNLNASYGFTQKFIQELGVNEANNLITKSGQLSQSGENRVMGAILHGAYGSKKITDAVTSELGVVGRNVLKSITSKAPQVTKLNNMTKEGKLAANTLAEDIKTAAETYIDLVESKQKIDDFLKSDALFASEEAFTMKPEVKEIIGDFHRNARSAVAIGRNLQARIDAIVRAGDPEYSDLLAEFETDEPAPKQTPSSPQAATQLTDENPTVNIPAPKKAPRELSDKAMVREMQKPTAKNTETDYKAALNLSEGQNLGRLIMSSGRVFDDAVVKSMDDKGVTVEATVDGKRGLHKGMQYQTVDAGINNTKSYEKQQAAATESKVDKAERAISAVFAKDQSPLDHGELSIPNRTKNIDKELDKYKADKAKADAKKLDEVKTKNAEKAEAEKERLLPIKEQAQADYKQYGTAMVNAYKDKLEAQGVNARDFFRDEAKYNPESFLKLSKKFQEEQQAEPKDSASVIESTNNPNPTGDWQTQVNGNEFRINEDGVTVRKHDRVVHIRGANSIAANKKAKQLASQDIRELHYIAAKEDASDPFSEGSIWLDGNGDMVRKKGTKKPTGSLLPILKQAEAETKTAPKKADKPATPTEPAAEIEDFGEKITGARKDMQSFYQKEITDDDIISQPLSKIWPKKDIDAIEDTQMAALATTLRGTIPSKPRKGYRLNSWVSKVKSTRGIMQNMLSGDMPANEFISQLTQVEAVADIGYQAQLLAQLDKEQWSRIDKVDPQIGYQKRNENGDYIPFVGFAVTIDKRTHTFNTEQRDISEIIDKVNNLLAGEVKTQALKFDLYSRGRGDTKSWFITQASDKDKTPLIEFNDRDAARAFLKENNSELSELWDQHKERVNVKKSDMRSNANRERIGPDHRSGQDVTTEQFMNTFGLRGGQFGNWVKQGANSKDRQNMLNDAYDAFMDLAGVLNIPPEAIGLGGKLAMSFGARGKGRAMAHYEPSQVIINLTKTQGAGSLAHEWFHALDNHFTSFRDDPNRLTSKENAYITYKPEPMLVMKDRNGNPSSMRITEARRKQTYEMNKNRAYLPENFLPDPNHKEGVRPQVEVAFANLVETLDESPMKARAVTIDKGAPDGYWSRIIERAARAFESYVINKLEKQGARSDFLANVTPEDAFPRNMDRYPYLLESEMAPVAEAFDNLFATIDSKASEDGNGKTLFSRAGQLNQAIDKVKANAVGSTNTTRQQVITKLANRFGKETIGKLIADGKLDVKVLSDFMLDGELVIPSDVDGLYFRGKVTLIADNLSDDMIIPTFLHELGGHGGMQGLMDKKAYNALMRDFGDLVRAGDPLAIQAKAMADKVARDAQEALDEYLPYLITLASRQQAKQGKVAGMINRMVMAIRSWLKNTLGVPIQINAQDILSLAERMVNEIEKQGSTLDTTNAVPQFSDPNIPDKQMQDVRAQYENTDQWMTAPNGKPTNLTENQWVQTRTPAFKQWFGDWQNDPKNASKIVDDNGEPRITYHQTDNAWTTFDKTKAKAGKHDNETPTGIFVKGSDRDIGIGENLNQMPLFTNIKNPLELKDRQAAKKYYESNVDGYAEIVARMKKDDGTYSKALDEAESSIQAELKRRYETGDRSQSSKELFKKSRDILDEWTASQQANSLAAKKLIDDHLAENDIDGVVLEIDEGSFGRETNAIVAINNNQIKSATDNVGTFNASNPDIRFSDPNVPAKQLDDVRAKYEDTDEWMKTPNGSDTNLNEQQWLQVRTPAFKEWFGDWEGDPDNASKVVDGNGEPMILYHGSPTGGDFNTFAPSDDYNAVFFAENKDFAKKYTKINGIGQDKVKGNEKLFEVFLNAKNYFDYDNKAHVEKVIDTIFQTNETFEINDSERLILDGDKTMYDREVVELGFLPSERNNNWDFIENEFVQDAIKVAGFDGFAVTEGQRNIAVYQPNQIKSATNNAGTFDSNNNDIRYSRAGGMSDQFDPINMARESKQRLYDWASSAPPGKLSWWHKTLGTMYNLSQRNPYFKPVYQSTEKFINDVSFYASKASEFAPRLLPQLDSIRDITKSAIGAKDNEALSKPIFEGTLLWGRDLDGKAVLIEDWRKKVMAASKQDRLQMLKDANRITPAQLQQLATLNNIQANRFINGIIDEEVNAGLVWTDAELRSKFNLDDKQIELYKEFRATTDNSLDSMTRSDMLRRLGKDAAAIEKAVMEAGTLREAVFNIEQHINSLIQASPKKEKSLKNTLKDIKESKFRTDKLIDDGYAPLSRFGQYTVDVVDADGNREYFGMFESAYEARKMKAEMDALYGNDDDFTVTQGALSNEEFKLFAGVTPETAELFGEMMGLDATGDKAADDAFQEYLRRTKNNRSTMKRLMHRKGIKGYSEDVGRVLASFVYSNARHTSAALNMGNLDRSIQDIPKGEGQLKDAAVKLAEYIKNPQEEGNVIRGWMFAQYLGGSIASAAVNITQPIAVSFPYLSQFGGAVKAASQLSRSSSDWAKSLKNKNNDHFEADLRKAIERAEADGTLSPQEVHNLLKQASGKNPLSAGDGTKIGDAKALAGNTLSRVSLAWGSLFSLAEQVNRRVTFVAAYRMAVEQGMDNPAEFATKSIKETQFVYNKASRMNWGRGAVGGTLMTFKTYTVSYMELMNRLWTQGEKGSEERAQGRKAVGIMLGTLFLLGGAGGLPFMEDAEDLVDGIGQIMGYNFSSKKVRQDFLDEWIGEFAGDFIDGGISSVSGSPTDVSGRLGLGNLIPGTGIFKERTSNVRDILEVAGPAGDFVGRIGTGTRDIAKGVANLDTTSLKKGALEFAPTAVRNAVKGVSMATTGIYKDTKGYKVADVSPIDSAFKAIGFQPRDISKIQEANYLGQSSTSYYNLRASNIRALWAAGVNEGNQSKVADARAAVQDWNAKNPTQKIVIKPNDIAKRVREMRMDKSERVIKKAPKSSRGSLAEDFAKAGQ